MLLYNAPPVGQQRVLGPEHARAIVGVSADESTVRLVSYEAQLSWRVETIDTVYIVDGTTGNIVNEWPNIWDGLNRRTYATSNCRALPGQLWITEEGPVPGMPVDDVAWGAHDNAAFFFADLWFTFKRDSFDGKGGPIVQTVHSGVNTGFTCDHNNAAYFPYLQQIAYGDGDGIRFSPLALDPTVVCHEAGHWIVHTTIKWPDGSPRGLDYHDEPGALNESYADFFAAWSNDTWLIGEKCYTPQTPGDALRDMADPTRYGQPDHYSKYVNTGTQSYRVHMNSGIMNKCAYLMSQAVGVDAAIRIWYYALFNMPGDATFAVARGVMEQTARELGIDVNAVGAAFAAVGIGAPAETPTAGPTLTATPKPTATQTPKPTATQTPKPTATQTPKPTVGLCQKCTNSTECPPGWWCKQCPGIPHKICVPMIGHSTWCLYCKDKWR